jgi:hypothetical protein
MLHHQTDKLADKVGMRFGAEMSKQGVDLVNKQKVGDTSKYDPQVISSQGSIDQG